MPLTCIGTLGWVGLIRKALPPGGCLPHTPCPARAVGEGAWFLYGFHETVRVTPGTWCHTPWGMPTT